MKCYGTNVTDEKMICNILNEHFCTVGTKITSMQSMIGNPMSYLKKISTAVLKLDPISKIIEKLPKKLAWGMMELVVY